MTSPDREEFSALNRFEDDDDHDGFEDGDDSGEYGISVPRPPAPPSADGARSSRFRRVRSLCLSAAMIVLGAAIGSGLDRRLHGGSGGGGGGGGGVGHVAPAAVAANVQDDDAVDDDAPSFDEQEEEDYGNATNSTGRERDSPLPPLSSLVHGTKITGDVSWLLDFAVVDFPKCGTTFLMNYLGKSDETYINHGEVCSMDRDRPYKVVNRYYPLKKDKRRTSDGRRIRYGLKCPEELETELALADYAEYFPRTKFVVTIRHPVLWFQSYYNFRAYNSYPLRMPPTDDLIGPCMAGYAYVPWNCSHHCPSGNMKVCTDRAKFHHALSRLGKTPMTSKGERALLDHDMKVVPTTNKIFLMENRQIILENPASESFPRDLRDFLELERDLAPLKHFEKKPDRYDNEAALREKIDICEAQHAKARRVLVQHGRDAAKWIREYFLQSEDVVVSSRERFVELLDDWGTDPCDDPKRFFLR